VSIRSTRSWLLGTDQKTAGIAVRNVFRENLTRGARVTLFLRDRRDKELEQSVVYQVALEPELAVLRND